MHNIGSVRGVFTLNKMQQGSFLPCCATKNPLADFRCQPKDTACGFSFFVSFTAGTSCSVVGRQNSSSPGTVKLSFATRQD